MRRSTSATARARSSSTLRSSPKTLTPTSERMPVVSMLIRLMMGWVQMFETPGRVVATSSSAISFSRVIPGRHWDSGLRLTMASVMFTGAGSVEVSAREIFATTPATSGTLRMAAFCFLLISIACGREIAGSVTGMNMRCPSFRGGMNSFPIRGTRARAPTSTRAPTPSVSAR